MKLKQNTPLLTHGTPQRSALSPISDPIVEVLDSVMGCDLGNICAKVEK
jgi:hypothetical protein